MGDDDTMRSLSPPAVGHNRSTNARTTHCASSPRAGLEQGATDGRAQQPEGGLPSSRRPRARHPCPMEIDERPV